MAPLIPSCPAGKSRYSAALKLMIGLLEKPHHSQCQQANYFCGRNCQKNSSRLDVLEWYIEIANENNLGLADITIFPKMVDHGSFTVHTSVCNMWSSYIDRLKAEVNKGKKKWINHILVRCFSIIYCLISNYLKGGDNVEYHALQLRKWQRINPAYLVSESVFIESSLNGSCEEIQFSTSSIQQASEFGK